MAAICQICYSSGSNIVKCSSCGKIYCRSCSLRGKGGYPKNTSHNKCSYCGKLNMLENYKGPSTRKEEIMP